MNAKSSSNINNIKIIRNKDEKRRKLHQMERSPKNNTNIKSIKSKIDCWGETQSNFVSNYSKRNITSPNNDKTKFNPQILQRIENEISNINAKLSITEHNQQKEDKFKNIPLAYIKQDSFYVKHYNSEIYDQLLIHLNKHYDELKS